MLKWLIKMKRDCLLSAFWQPWQIIPQTLLPLDFSFFPKIVFNISENKLDTIFTVAWIYSMDVRAEACPLTSEAAPREIKASHRNYLAPEPWPGGKKCRRECRNLKDHALLLLFKNSPEISQVRDSWVTTKKLWRQVKRDDIQTWSEHKVCALAISTTFPIRPDGRE